MILYLFLAHKVNPNITKNVDYFEKLSKHKFLLPVYDLEPYLGHCWVAPNATVIGEVSLSDFVSVWHNVVIRGDINSVHVLQYTSIGDRTVIHTANSLPTGFSAGVFIGQHCIIQPGCSIYSSVIEDEVFIGANSVIMEGVRIEKGAIILPNSVVPPGRLIPASQVWGGNPVQYIRDAKESEVFAHYAFTYEIYSLSTSYLNQFTPWSYNYLEKQSTREEVDLSPSEIAQIYVKSTPKISKYYYDYGLA